MQRLLSLSQHTASLMYVILDVEHLVLVKCDLVLRFACVAGARPVPNGAQSFWATAPQGSWQINLPSAGHMSFLDYNPASDPGFCPLHLPLRT